MCCVSVESDGEGKALHRLRALRAALSRTRLWHDRPRLARSWGPVAQAAFTKSAVTPKTPTLDRSPAPFLTPAAQLSSWTTPSLNDRAATGSGLGAAAHARGPQREPSQGFGSPLLFLFKSRTK